MNEIKCFIIAAGEATRFYPYTQVMPKCMIPIAGKPVLQWIVEHLLSHNFRDIFVCVNSKDYDYISNFFEHKYPQFSNMFYLKSDYPQGTSGEIADTVKKYKEDYLIYYGDEILDMNFTRMIQLFDKHKIDKNVGGILGMERLHPSDYGVLDLQEMSTNDGIVTFVNRIDEKKLLEVPRWNGVAIMSKRSIKYLGVGKDFAQHVFPEMIGYGYKFLAFESGTISLDVGHYKQWLKANELLKSHRSWKY